MKAKIEPIETPSTICSFTVDGYTVALWACDYSPGAHEGMNIIAQTGEIYPVPRSADGANIFVLENKTGDLNEHEVGWMILAQNLTVALEYIANQKQQMKTEINLTLNNGEDFVGQLSDEFWEKLDAATRAEMKKQEVTQ